MKRRESLSLPDLARLLYFFPELEAFARLDTPDWDDQEASYEHLVTAGARR